MVTNLRGFFGDEEVGGVRIIEPDTEVNVEERGKNFDSDDAGRYAHWVESEKAVKSKVTGRPIIALCGKVWVPEHNPDDYPICPRCQELYEEITREVDN